ALRLARPRRPGQGVLRARATITVNRPPREVYRFWRELENLPRFMYHLRTVRDLGGGRSYWVARAPGSREVTWHAEIVAEVPERLLAWRSLPGARVRNAGMVTFTPAPRGSGTEVTVELGFQPPFGRLGAAVAALFGEEPHQQVRDDLRRFKQRLETGEIVRSDGSPEGTMVRQQARQRAAQPMG
ncbi:MAG TPA: SRPBCC family protein, partial [Natronosporangium sp.]|nr:SRPBCC family protein [Natronosporangium sp.]